MIEDSGTGLPCAETGSGNLLPLPGVPPDTTRGTGVAGQVDPIAGWHKSSTSEESNCVEVAVTSSTVLVRNSRDRSGRILSFTYGEWDAFLAGVRNNEFSVDVLIASPGD